MKLSVIVPSIRINSLTKLYWSVLSSCQCVFEFIVISPNDFLEWPNPSPNVKWIKSHRSPNTCQQQGLLEATGDYICFAADDGEFLPGALEEACYLMKISKLEYGADSYRTIVVGKYLEGNSPIGMKSEDYYRFKYHKPYRLAGINPEWIIFNCGLISNKFIGELGGWDAENFEVPTIGHADLGIRAQKAGAKMVLMKEPMFKCSHQPGKSGDHAPIHVAQTKRDLPRFQEMYAKPNDRINITLDNWKNTPEVWKERFK